jgi:predicted O-methyltransferase YrrM
MVLARQYAESPSSFDLGDVGFSVFSEFEEDGILLYLFAALGPGNRRLVEIGCGNGLQNNTTNLILNHRWTGVLIDANETNAANARRFFESEAAATKLLQPTILGTFVTPANVNSLLTDAGITDKEVDLLSIDIDSVDLWVLEALEVIRPRVIVAEINARWDAHESKSTPRDAVDAPHFHPKYGMIYGGASLAAFHKLLGRRGYRLVASNAMATNVFFVREDCAPDYLPAIEPRQILDKERARRIRALCKDHLADYRWSDYE